MIQRTLMASTLTSRRQARLASRRAFWGLLAWLAVLAGGASPASTPQATTAPLTSLTPVAAGNHWLASCLVDLGFAPNDLVDVVPPGSCPGHFDLPPGRALALRSARLAVFFDFQQAIAQRLRAVALTTPPLIVTPRGGLCVPDTYEAAAHNLACELVARAPATSPVLQRRLDALALRLRALETEVRSAVDLAGWRAVPVVASRHQAEFCRWLGLDVVATLPSPDAATPRQIEQLLAQARARRARVVIANLQEGTKAAEVVAQRLGVPAVVFSNFPALDSQEPDFVALVRRNVARLCTAGTNRQESAR